MPSKIEWCDEVWNPIIGCTPISTGCQRCYAKGFAKRFAEKWDLDTENPFKPAQRRPGALEKPLRWRKPRKIFVCSMGDLFHEDVKDWMIDEVMSVILACQMFGKDHIFMILTKRADRMYEYFSREGDDILKRWADYGGFIHPHDEDMTFANIIESHTCMKWEDGYGVPYSYGGYYSHPENLLPLNNLWLGVTVENQEETDKRLPHLISIPGDWKRFISAEPMLGEIDIRSYLKTDKLHWVICGGENGQGARNMNPEWVYDLHLQTRKKVPFFFKGWGKNDKVKKIYRKRCEELPKEMSW